LALALLQRVEQTFLNIMGTIHQSDASAELFRNGNDVSPEELSVAIEVGQNDIDRSGFLLSDQKEGRRS
jgi:hypothetical protein